MSRLASEHAQKILIAVDEIKTYKEQLNKTVDEATKQEFKGKIQGLLQSIDQESSQIFSIAKAAEGLPAMGAGRAKIQIQSRRPSQRAPQAAPAKTGSLQERLRSLLPGGGQTQAEPVAAPATAPVPSPAPTPTPSAEPTAATSPPQTAAPAPTPTAPSPSTPPPAAQAAPIPVPQVPTPAPSAAVPSPTVPTPTLAESIETTPEVTPEPPMQPEPILSPELASKKFKLLSKRKKEFYIKEIGIKYEELEDFVKLQQKKKKAKVKEIKTEDFTLYSPSSLGALANKFMKQTADNLVARYPKLFEPMFATFLKVNMPILSRSYVSTLLFFSFLIFPGVLGFLLLVNLAFKFNLLLVIALAVVIGLFTPVAFYYYPSSLIGERQKKIKTDLPFALVHMSAVAGSGAAPISIFELLAETDEYPELKKEIKKILNYVNLFGYNLSNALRNVAQTTPSEELKELLNGMISTVESGGDLKAYLNEKSADALNRYRLDRKKLVEALGTYSELYTSILIAAPLLMIVTLAIVNTIGGQLGGLSVKLLANLGIYLALPILNLGFMFFLKVQTSE